MKIKQLIEIKIKHVKYQLEVLERNLEKVELGIIPNDNTIRTCPECQTKNLHYSAETNNWCCACC